MRTNDNYVSRELAETLAEEVIRVVPNLISDIEWGHRKRDEDIAVVGDFLYDLALAIEEGRLCEWYEDYDGIDA